jgi:hypothetical protein
MTISHHPITRGKDPNGEAQFILTETDGTILTKTELTDGYGWEMEFTPNDELRVITPYRVVGSTFSSTVIDPNYWTANTGTGGSSAITNGQLILTTGTTQNNPTNVQSVRIGRYVGGSSMRARIIMRLPDTGTTGNIRRWGVFTTTNGAFFQLTGNTLQIVTRKTSSANDVVVDIGVWNGEDYTPDTNVHTYEIYYNNSRVYFVINGAIVHTVSASTATWSDTLNLPLRFENNSVNGGATNVAMNIRNAVITRLGAATTDPTYKNVKTATTTVCKAGPGTLHTLTINGEGSTGNTVAIYDAPSSPATPYPLIGTVSLNRTGIANFSYDTPFNNGLTLVTNSTVDITAIYE